MEIKNQLEQCPNGHYYNSALHPTCPICAQGSIPATEPFPATSAPGGTYTADSPYMAENPGFPGRSRFPLIVPFPRPLHPSSPP